MITSPRVRAATVERKQRGGRVAFADGQHFEFAAIPLPDGNALFTMLDVTDSRRIEQVLRDRNTALEEADQIKTAFVSNMSYELRTPLTSIAGFTEMLQAGYAGELPDQAQEYVGAIMESVARLASLIFVAGAIERFRLPAAEAKLMLCLFAVQPQGLHDRTVVDGKKHGLVVGEILVRMPLP